MLQNTFDLPTSGVPSPSESFPLASATSTSTGVPVTSMQGLLFCAGMYLKDKVTVTKALRLIYLQATFFETSL